jgi:polyisoprenoid-binding protein YceI
VDAARDLTLRGQNRPVTVKVTLQRLPLCDEATLKQTNFGIKPPGKAGIRAKGDVRIEFDVRVTS